MSETKSKIEKVNIAEIQEGLYEKLKPSGWAAHLKGFILSAEFTKILMKLLEDSQNSKNFTPKVKQLFRAFEECPYNDLKVIILGQDPYTTLEDDVNVADGIAFSCGNTGAIQPDLKFMLNEVQDQIYPQGMTNWDPDLKRWANQGVLLLNSALTTTLGKTGTHYLLWEPFIVYVLDYLSWNNPGLIYAFLGKKAQEFMPGMTENNWKFTAPHPVVGAYDKDDKWESNDLFKKISEQLHKNNNLKITW